MPILTSAEKAQAAAAKIAEAKAQAELQKQ